MDFHDSLVTEALFSEVARKDWQDFIKKYEKEKPGTFYCQFTNFAGSVDDKRFVGALARSKEGKSPTTPGSYVIDSKRGIDYKTGPDEKTQSHDKQALRRATPDMSLWTSPGHHDPIGIYTYPAELVIEKSGHVPYGRDMKFMRVLKAKPGIKRLELQEMTDKAENLRILEKAGVFELTKLDPNDDRTPELVWDHAIGRIKSAYVDWQTNTTQKVFFWLLQRQLGAVGLTFGVELNNEAQTRRLRDLGYDMVEDKAKTREEAIIFPNEPTQAFFINRAAFDIVDVYNANLEVKRGKNKENIGAFSVKAVEMKIAHAVADLLGDQVHRSLKGVHGGVDFDAGDADETELDYKTAFLTKKGRRMGANAKYDTDEVGQGHVPIAVVFELKGEKGIVRDTLTPRESIKDFAERLVAKFRSQPDDTRWTPKRGGPNEGEQMWRQLLTYVADHTQSYSESGAEYKPGHAINRSINLKGLVTEATYVCQKLSEQMEAVGWHWKMPAEWYERIAAWVLSEEIHQGINRINDTTVKREAIERLIEEYKNFSKYDWHSNIINRAADEITDPERLKAYTEIQQALNGRPSPGVKPGWWDSLLNGLTFLYTKNADQFISKARYQNFGFSQKEKLHHALGNKPPEVKPAAVSS